MDWHYFGFGVLFSLKQWYTRRGTWNFGNADHDHRVLHCRFA
jgi:hypothetical protein